MDKTLGALPGETASGLEDAFIIKVSGAGSVLWSRQFGSSAYDSAFGVALDSSGSVFVVGTTNGALSGQTSGGALDAFVCKYTPAGALQWLRQFGTASTDRANALAIDSTDTLWVVGQTKGTFVGQTASGLDDAYVQKFDVSGTALTAQQFGTTTIDEATAVAVIASGGAYVVGSTADGLFGQAPVSSYDAFVVRFGP